jgi:pimeloyl-ACP methyl ester carboxylesterase
VQPICNAEGLAGRSGAADYDADVERESIGLTLNAAGVSEMHLVGWSNGGRMALDFALANPERIRTLTLIEPAAWWLVADEDQGAREFHDYLIALAGRQITDEDLCEFLVRAGLGGADADFKSLPQWDFWSSCRQALSWFSQRTASSAEVGIEGLGRLDVPTLLVRGRATAPWLWKTVDHLQHRLPHSEALELDGGHACILESPDEFVAALAEHAGRR